MINKLSYKITLILTLIFSPSLHGAAAAAAAAPERRITTQFDDDDDLSIPAPPPSTPTSIASEAELNAAFAHQQTSVREGLAPLALGSHGPLKIVFAYLQWNKSKPDIMSEPFSPGQRAQQYIMAGDGRGLYSNTAQVNRVELHATQRNHSCGTIYRTPPGVPNSNHGVSLFEHICRLPDGRIMAFLNDRIKCRAHIMTICPRTHGAIHGSDIPLGYGWNQYKQHGSNFIVAHRNSLIAFDINHSEPPRIVSGHEYDDFISIKKLTTTFLVTIKSRDRKFFVQRFDAMTLNPIGRQLEIADHSKFKDSPHLAIDPPLIKALNDEELLVQTPSSSRVINIETGVDKYPKLTVELTAIRRIFPLKNMNRRPTNRRRILITNIFGEIGLLKIHKKNMSFTMITNMITNQQRTDHGSSRLQQLSHDQVALLTPTDLTIWSIRQRTKLAHFSKDFFYHRIKNADNKFIKSDRGSLIVADPAGNVARLTPESDIEMAYNGKRPIIIRPSGAPAMKPTILTIRDASAIPAKKV